LPPSTANRIDFNSYGTDIAVGYNTGAGVGVYPWNAGFGTRYSDPASLPVYGNGVAFSNKTT
jgi:hypothetical protein